MATPLADLAGPGPDAVRRRPEQLLLAFMGELVVDRGIGPVPTSTLLDLLAELGVGPGATRATLSRMAGRGLLEPVRTGRTVSHGLTPASERVLREARGRVFADDPFAPHGSGWTLVTFSVPETRRDVRHRVRAQLAWAGFGLLRDGLWIAPGEVDVAEALGGVHEGGRPDDGFALLAFRAHEVPGFSAARSVRTAWRLQEMRARHEEFQARWADGAPTAGAPTAGAGSAGAGSAGAGSAALRDLTGLVADWLDLLRAVPRLPAEHLDPDWPGRRSVSTFRHLHAALAGPARIELARRLGH